MLIFPEGTRSRAGEMEPFRQGIGLLTAQAGVPVLPVALLGLEKVGASGARWFRSGQIEVRIGSVVQWAESKSPAEWTAEIERAIRELRQTSE